MASRASQADSIYSGLAAKIQSLRTPWYGKAFYYFLPFRRGLVLRNLRLVFGDTLSEDEICRLAQAFYAHFGLFLLELLRLPFTSAAGRKRLVRIENLQAIGRAHKEGKGVIFLSGHFGNWEVATVAVIGQFPAFRGVFHFVRRPLKPRWLDDFVTRRFQGAGFGTIEKRGSMDRMLDLMAKGAIVIYVFDQYASGKEGVMVDFLGHPANTFKSVALLAMASGAPVVPASTWREPDGTHVIRFEEKLPLIESESVSEAIRLNTQAYNDALQRIILRHPEQWIWMHKRWR